MCLYMCDIHIDEYNVLIAVFVLISLWRYSLLPCERVSFVSPLCLVVVSFAFCLAHCHRWACKKYIHIVNLLLNNIHCRRCRRRCRRCCRLHWPFRCCRELCSFTQPFGCPRWLSVCFAAILFNFHDKKKRIVSRPHVLHMYKQFYCVHVHFRQFWCMPTLC